jgi:2-hydroxymuconate-semialdehyde hydrolase
MSAMSTAQRNSDATHARDRLLRGVRLEQRFVEVHGTRTMLLECGQGPPLVLLHGGIECGGAYWAPVLARLARTHRLIVPDVPGLGESEPVAKLDDAAFASWLAALLGQTCDEPPSLIAHSLLGTMAARFAATEGRTLRQLVVYAAPGVGPYRMPWGLRFAAIMFALRPSERNAERFDRWAFADYDAVRERDPEWLAAFSSYCRERATTPHVKRTMRQLIGSCTRQIADAELQRIEAPASLLWPRHDRFVPLSLAEGTHARLGWPLHVVENAGHACHIEQPGAFVDGVLEALASPALSTVGQHASA